jgi:hypothetical protein
VLGTVVAVAAVAASVVGMGRVSFRRRVAGEIDHLFAAGRATQPGVITEAELAGLPSRSSGGCGTRGSSAGEHLTTVRLKQEGMLRLGNRGWFPFRAEQYYTTEPPGFVWTTSIAMAPLVSVIGRDRYVDGTGEHRDASARVIPVASDRGPDMDRGALLRYLNEVMWFPAGALSPYIRWEPIDASSARRRCATAG